MKHVFAAVVVAAMMMPAAASAGHHYKKGAGYGKHASAHEWGAIVDKLTHHGFVQWDYIKLRGGKTWKVDDAVHHKGGTYDLYLERGSLKLIKKKQER